MANVSFLRGAMVLTIAGIVVKILGGINRILLSRLLGGEGIGLYQMAYPVYILLLSIVGAGIPIAVSIMVAEQAARGNFTGTRRILHVTLSVMSAASAWSSVPASSSIPASSVIPGHTCPWPSWRRPYPCRF